MLSQDESTFSKSHPSTGMVVGALSEMKTRKSFLLRIDPRLYEELETWAAAELRSVNAQVEFLLKECVKRRRKATTDDDEKQTGSQDDRDSDDIA